MKSRSRWELALSLVIVSTLIMVPNSAFGDLTSLPNQVTTPGATNPLVTQENISTTICRNGYTATIRPPVSYTNALKRHQLTSSPYSDYGSSDLKLFEEDHLIPLELGGSPTSVQNLWPEPWSGSLGARHKDQLENKLHTLVCAGSISLVAAQSAISANWEDAYQRFVLGIFTRPSLTPPTPSTPPAPPPPVTPSQPPGATGLCKDGTYSYAAHHQGMCSGHGGVAQFYS